MNRKAEDSDVTKITLALNDLNEVAKKLISSNCTVQAIQVSDPAMGDQLIVVPIQSLLDLARENEKIWEVGYDLAELEF